MAKRSKKRGELVDLEDLAAALGKNRRTIHEYRRRGLPREKSGRYDVAKCRAWCEANVRPSGRPGCDPGCDAECEQADSGPAGPARDDAAELQRGIGYWHKHLIREKALVEEYRRRKLEGELIEVDVVARHNAQRITHCKTLLEQIPDRCLGLLPKAVAAARRKEFRDRIADMIEDALYALSEQQTAHDPANPSPPAERA